MATTVAPADEIQQVWQEYKKDQAFEKPVG